MDEMEVFRDMKAIIHKHENYVPRNYQTIGGMWTVDTYAIGEFRFQIMDEGYTNQIVTPNTIVHTVTDYQAKPIKTTLKFAKGSFETLEKDYIELTAKIE